MINTSKIGIFMFITFFVLIQIRNIYRYKLYNFKQKKSLKFYVNWFAVILTFIISFWALNKFVFG